MDPLDYGGGKIFLLQRLQRYGGSVSYDPEFALLVATWCLLKIKMCVSLQIHRLVFGTLYPAYYSYKAVKSKNVKEYVSMDFANIYLRAAIGSHLP